MKLFRIAFPIAIAAAVALTGCSSAKDTSQEKVTATSAASTTTTPAVAATSTTSPAPAPAPTVNNEPSAANSAAFVTAFRAQFPEFALGRKDNPIKNLLENTCQEISTNKEPHIIVSNVGKRAANQGVNPTAEQSQAIYDLVASHCSN